MSRRTTRARASVRVLGVALAATLALTACTEEAGPAGEDATPEEVLQLAKENLDETEGVRISLSTDDLPPDVEGLISADGIGTHAPAFDGTIVVRYAGLEPRVPVVAVDGKVYAQVPLTTGWSDIDPAEYGAPDPAALMSADTGFSSLLSATEGAQEGQQVRGGDDNRDVLTEYTGTVDGETVKNLIPSASGDFDVSYTVDDEGRLREMAVTGVFYRDSAPTTYTIAFDDYGTSKEITAP